MIDWGIPWRVLGERQLYSGAKLQATMSIEDEQGVDSGWGLDGTESLLPYVAFLGVALTLGSTLLSTTLSPSFAWQSNALSNLGVTSSDAGTTTTVVVFNGGLILGGLVGAAFNAASYRRLSVRRDRILAALAGTALGLMALIGVFPQNTAMHFPVAIGYFLLISVTLWVDGTARVRAGKTRAGGLALAGGTVNLLAWVLWFGLLEDPFEGIAIPEIIGSVVFGVWLCSFAVRIAGDL